MGGEGEKALTVKDKYDVLVVGAGPAGLTAAQRLSEQGWSVAVLEEHAHIGNPVNCSGVLGVEAFERFHLPSELIRHSLSSLEFVSPRGLRWEFEMTRALAHVVVRGELDRHLGECARNAGVNVLLGHRVTAVQPATGGLQVTVSAGEPGLERALAARAVVIATGAGMPLLNKLGFNSSPSRLLGVQTELALPAGSCAMSGNIAAICTSMTSEECSSGLTILVYRRSSTQRPEGVTYSPTTSRSSALWSRTSILEWLLAS